MADHLRGRTVTRRDLLCGLASLAIAAPASANAAADPSLAAIAAARGIRFGSEIVADDLVDRRLTGLIDRECAIVVPGNELKLATIMPVAGDALDFAPGDRIARFARAYRKALRGHTLLWPKDEVTPDWLLHHDFGARPKVAAETMLRNYVRAVTRHAGPSITSWDVVNEAVDATTGELRSSVFTRILGRDAIRIAFETAHESAPGVPLVYNDYVDWRADREPHRQGVLALLRWLRERDVPVAALGIQSHIKTLQTFIDADRWGAFLAAIAASGLEMKITEFDVNDQLAPGTVAERDREVADTARRYLDQLLDLKQVRDMLLWGISDGHSWAAATKTRADGLPIRPTPYDERFRPKPLRDAIASALRLAPDRR